MSDRRAGWLVVILAAGIGAVVGLVAYFAVFQDALTAAYLSSAPTAPGSWVDGAIAGLSTAALGLLMVIVLAAVGFVIGKDLWVRVVAVAVAVCTIAGVAIAGGAGMLAAGAAASEYWESNPYRPGTFDCLALDAATPPELQAAIDELEHPDPVEVYLTGGDACGAFLIDVTMDEAVTFYRPQLEDAGWTVEEAGGTALTARRAGYTFLITACGTPAVVVHVTAAADRSWC